MAKRDKARDEPSVVEDHGLYSSSCGYCKSDAKTSISYGLSAHSLSVYDYQDLLNRGWRRSGMFLYKPEMTKTCCPAYTIRLKVDAFCPSKEQKRLKQRMQRYLDGTFSGPVPALKESSKVPGRQVSSGIQAIELFPDRSHETSYFDMECDGVSEIANSTGQCAEIHTIVKDLSDAVKDAITVCSLSGHLPTEIANSTGQCADIHTIVKDLSDAVKDAITVCSLSGHLPTDLEVPKVALQRVKPTMRRRIKTSCGEVVFSCGVAFLCAAALSKHKDYELVFKALQQGKGCLERQSNDGRKVSPAVLAELFASKLQNKDGMHGFIVEALNGHLNFVLQNPASSDFWKREDVHPIRSASGGAETCTSKSVKKVPVSPHIPAQLKPRRVLEIRTSRSAFDPEEFALYKRYQIAVHHDKPDDVKESSYVRFLVNSPLTFVPPSKSGTSFCGFGSFHQQYLIDGRLVAVGVMDILPLCLSSKYLFWDPDLAFLSLGKYSALKEIEWVQEAHTYCPSLEYYYLGYYIHSCPKMRYKGDYRPSELLCPVRFQWVPFDIARPLLNIQPFVCLSDFLDAMVMQKHSKNIAVRYKSSVVVEDSEGNNEIAEMEENQTLDVSQPGGVASSSKESEDVSNILLKLGNQFLQFKHLEAWTAVPQKFIDVLVCDLRKYSQVVGPALATKMAYVLG